MSSRGAGPGAHPDGKQTDGRDRATCKAGWCLGGEPAAGALPESGREERPGNVDAGAGILLKKTGAVTLPLDSPSVPTECGGKLGAKRLHPVQHRVCGDINATLGEQPHDLGGQERQTQYHLTAIKIASVGQRYPENAEVEEAVEYRRQGR